MLFMKILQNSNSSEIILDIYLRLISLKTIIKKKIQRKKAHSNYLIMLILFSDHAGVE